LWLESDLLNFHAEIVSTSLDVEIAVHSPLWAIRVSDDPVFGSCLGVLTPTYYDYRVVHVHPGDALVVESNIRQFLGLSNPFDAFFLNFTCVGLLFLRELGQLKVRVDLD